VDKEKERIAISGQSSAFSLLLKSRSEAREPYNYHELAGDSGYFLSFDLSSVDGNSECAFP
jgi:hypothetical protein